MKARMKALFAATAFSLAVCGVSSAAQKGSKEEAVAMVKKSGDHGKSRRQTKSFCSIFRSG